MLMELFLKTTGFDNMIKPSSPVNGNKRGLGPATPIGMRSIRWRKPHYIIQGSFAMGECWFYGQALPRSGTMMAKACSIWTGTACSLGLLPRGSPEKVQLPTIMDAGGAVFHRDSSAKNQRGRKRIDGRTGSHYQRQS